MNGLLTTSVRDKGIIAALILFGLCAFISIWINRELAQMMIGVIGSIVAGLFGIYKGNPSPDSASPTASVSSSTETTTKEIIDDKKGAVT